MSKFIPKMVVAHCQYYENYGTGFKPKGGSDFLIKTTTKNDQSTIIRKKVVLQTIPDANDHAKYELLGVSITELNQSVIDKCNALIEKSITAHDEDTPYGHILGYAQWKFSNDPVWEWFISNK